MTRLIFVRHGESQANQLRLFAGSSNFALTEKGVAQAQATAQELMPSMPLIYSGLITPALQSPGASHALFIKTAVCGKFRPVFGKAVLLIPLPKTIRKCILFGRRISEGQYYRKENP